jgi:hypothetical protein
MRSVPGLYNCSSGFKRLWVGDYKYRHRQQDDLISLLILFQNKRSRLNIEGLSHRKHRISITKVQPVDCRGMTSVSFSPWESHEIRNPPPITCQSENSTRLYGDSYIFRKHRYLTDLTDLIKLCVDWTAFQVILENFLSLVTVTRIRCCDNAVECEEHIVSIFRVGE